MNSVKIKTIKKLDKKLDRYDLTVPGNNNFFANGILIHNTSIIFGNIQTRTPRLPKTRFNFLNKLMLKVFMHMPDKWRTWDIDWEDVCSSRNVIRSGNAYVEEPRSTTSKVGKTGDNYPTGLDAVYPQWYEILKGKVDHGMIIYGEILGYVPNSETGIITRGGKVYDYGCKKGENKLMIYRVTEFNSMTGKYEDFEITDVIGYTNWLVETYPELEDKIFPLQLMYHGPAKDIYPDISTEEHWHENVVQRMKTDSEKFGMDLKEPLCKNKVWREGLVIRIENDPIQEAFKIKSNLYFEQEKKDMDKGVITGDMLEGYGDDEE